MQSLTRGMGGDYLGAVRVLKEEVDRLWGSTVFLRVLALEFVKVSLQVF